MSKPDHIANLWDAAAMLEELAAMAERQGEVEEAEKLKRFAASCLAGAKALRDRGKREDGEG